MLAVNETKIDLLSLGCQGQELEVQFFFSFHFPANIFPHKFLDSFCYSIYLQILETIPYNKVTIKIISIHLDEYYSTEMFSSMSSDVHSNDDYHKKIYRFLESKSYILVKEIKHNYIYQFIDNHNNNRNKNNSKNITVATVKTTQ